jgi:hypothetical protein
MKFIGKFGFIALSLTLGACSTKQASPPPALTLVTKAEPPSDPEPPPLTGAQILAQQPQEVQEAVKQHQQNGAWQVYKTPRRELYPYDEGQEPAVDCAPLRTTDIQLEPGETITDVASGDSERWLVTPATARRRRTTDTHSGNRPGRSNRNSNVRDDRSAAFGPHAVLHTVCGRPKQFDCRLRSLDRASFNRSRPD